MSLVFEFKCYFKFSYFYKIYSVVCFKLCFDVDAFALDVAWDDSYALF